MGEEAGSGLREWAEEEFGRAMMSDWRMQERVILIGEAMASQPGVGIGEMFGRVADVRAAYRFLEHKEATPENLRHGHQEGVELRMREAGVRTTADRITLTSGSQEGIEMSAKIFVNPGDVIICEKPS